MTIYEKEINEKKYRVGFIKRVKHPGAGEPQAFAKSTRTIRPREHPLTLIYSEEKETRVNRLFKGITNMPQKERNRLNRLLGLGLD